ncbi:biotin carboxylase N-terminal domain-containing protein [Microbacterium aquimaris]|uniref:acetyl/propionyl/methylcrotonyl-CoA carboxylase subunit alpha n=1 Tax=Microbacterium aquimaris TaxID=459816 RepID=UPI002AD2D153|nr:biotin carboxylase N-terminal domain-containing protein [Microbacterium aquimaris]MDZ8276111.1 biotin carboxylase N-terminal domain-containing protein [Microbacterium aquimaris]
MGSTDFSTVLVANRGEIARRVIRTLRRLGLRSVAVYSDADASAPHVREADAAVRIGPTAASESYLDIDAVLDAARRTDADAVHPGYGFLSENVAFARACRAHGIAFIGPGEDALEIMGDKIRAKAHVAASGVPTVPGFDLTGLTDDDAVARAREVGYPLLVKPSAGGGGKGMRVARDEVSLRESIASARRIARASFGDDALLVERLIERPRHIEVQVVADAHGGVIHLGERECTLQRRHQKVIEEAPSPVVDEPTRQRLGRSACDAARSVDYRGAGTVEFLVSADRPEEFFFIEMNTRLQVEHPVTEEITGLDLVELQVRIAEGHPLPMTQDSVCVDGHAVEARVYAESPARGFLPATGDVTRWRAPRDARTDAAVETGSTISAHYDPMIAKVITHAPTRAQAWRDLDRALADTVVLGVDTNLAFLRRLARDEDVLAGRLDTGLIERVGVSAPDRPDEETLARIASAELARQATGVRVGPLWGRMDGWRLGDAEPPVVTFLIDGDSVIRARPKPDAAPDAELARDDDGTWWAHRAGRIFSARPVSRRCVGDLARRDTRPDARGGAREAVAPMPGTVVAVHVADGDLVEDGDVLVTVEAMKMEQPVTAPRSGRVRSSVTAGDQVRRGDVLAVVASVDGGADPPPENEGEPDGSPRPGR